MKTAGQLAFATYEAALKLKPNDPTKIIFDNIDWSFVHSLVKSRYSPKGAEGYNPISRFKAQLLMYLGEVSSDRKLASGLRYNARLCLLCGFNFLKTPSNGTFTNALNRRGKVDAITAGSLYLSDDGTYTCSAGFKVVYWGKDKKRGRLKFRCPAALGKCQCLFRSTCSLSSYGKTFYLYPDRDYRLIGPIPRGTNLWQEKYNARTGVERAYSAEKGSHRLASPRVRGLSNVKTHVYLALCAQVIKLPY